jgi:peptidoglycan/LPS O-acetylase OafA/YrhL
MQAKVKLDALTSLRFFAAAMIVIGHADPIFGSFGLNAAMPLNQGVSFFFVLSGFILTWNYPQLTTWAERRKFWLARFARIWPLHAATCLLWIGLIFHFDRSAHFPGLMGLAKLAANLTLLQVWWPVHDWVLSFNGVAWSISAEFFFYAMFPFLITRWQRWWPQIFLLLGSIVVITITLSNVFQLPPADDYPGIGMLGILYFNPLVRVFEFTVGIAVAKIVSWPALKELKLETSQWLLLESAALTAVIIAMLAASSLSGVRQTLGDTAAYYVERDGLWLFWASVIAVFSHSKGPIARFLSLRPIVFLGEISFALYLCHALLIHYLQDYTALIQPYGMLGYATFWVAALSFSAALFLGIETPCRKLILARANGRAKTSASQPGSKAAALTALLVILAATVSMVAFRPSTVKTLDADAVARFLQATPPSQQYGGGVVFDGRYQILALQILAQDSGAVRVQVLLKALKDLPSNDALAFHVNDREGKMLSNFDRKLDFGHRPMLAGSHWLQQFDIPKAQFEAGASIGLAMYRTPTTLFPAVGGLLDWGGKRFIVPLAGGVK